MMTIYLNGEPFELPKQTTMLELIQQQGLTGQRIAIEVNQELVPRSHFADYVLMPDQRVEIIRAVGGG
jgi:sulfur carrier protein